MFEKGCQKLSEHQQGKTTTNPPPALGTPAARPPAPVKRPIQSAAVEKGSQKRSLAGGTLWVQFGRGFQYSLVTFYNPDPGDNGVIHRARSRGTECERGPSPGGAGLRAPTPRVS